MDCLKQSQHGEQDVSRERAQGHRLRYSCWILFFSALARRNWWDLGGRTGSQSIHNWCERRAGSARRRPRVRATPLESKQKEMCYDTPRHTLHRVFKKPNIPTHAAALNLGRWSCAFGELQRARSTLWQPSTSGAERAMVALSGQACVMNN